MIELFLSKPIWSDDSNGEAHEQRSVLFDELEKMLWEVMTREGRSEARLWLCESISSLSSITPHEQHELFMSLLKSKPRKRELAKQVLQMIFERRPCEAGAILAKKSHRLEKFFDGHPRRMMQWFSTFSAGGDLAHGKGAKALSQFAFVNRDICWEELEWRGKHGQSPAVVATKPHYFLDLDIQRTMENFLDNVPEFWSSKEFSESLRGGEILSIDKKYFINLFLDFMYEDDLKEVWEVIGRVLLEESFSRLCQHLVIILKEQELCSILVKLQTFYRCKMERLNFDNKAYWLDILIRKCGDRVSIDQLLLLNALFNKGRQLLRLVHAGEAEEKEKFRDLVLDICKHTCEAKSLALISKDCLKSRDIEMIKWFGLLSWTLFYRLSTECDAESWKAVFVSNKVGFRKSDTYTLVEGNGSSEESELDPVYRSASKGKHRSRRKSRKKRKRNRDHDMLHDEELLGLDDLNDKFSLQSSATSWCISTDDYSTSWSLADLPEHLSMHCLKEWMRQTYGD